ncbi:hypothetical protein [Solitalea lacus]|uniref:hypothetical protein n=1 Tax=Solitalea lacus TaxID=2911172 RepID=UPI001EDC7DB1|nr:hypothetical protein [Solitalea lacus]UKJ07424.1 hypothetical protein L2B55_18110 [Solitalea lacus]
METITFIDKWGLHLIPCFLIVILKYRKCTAEYKPMLWFVLYLVFFKLIENGLRIGIHNNNLAYNLRPICGFIILMIVFKQWGLFKSKVSIFKIILGIQLLFFLLEIIYNKNLWAFALNYSKASANLLIAVFSLNVINKSMFSDNALQNNSKLYFSVALIIESAFLIYISIFLNERFNFHANFLSSIYFFYQIINIFL